MGCTGMPVLRGGWGVGSTFLVVGLSSPLHQEPHGVPRDAPLTQPHCSVLQLANASGLFSLFSNLFSSPSRPARGAMGGDMQLTQHNPSPQSNPAPILLWARAEPPCPDHIPQGHPRGARGQRWVPGWGSAAARQVACLLCKQDGQDVSRTRETRVGINFSWNRALCACVCASLGAPAAGGKLSQDSA